MRATAYILSLILLFVFLGCASMGKRTKCMWKGAAAGAVVGGGAGVAIGNQGDTDNRVEGSIIGAAAGAVVGGALGFMLCKEEVPPAVEAQEPITEQEEVSPPEPIVEEPKIIEKIVLNALWFDFDSAVVKPELFPVLDEAVAIIQKHPEKKVIIEGHTCWVGTEDYNEGLSLRRAASVKKYLIEKGIDPERLITKGYGEKRPIGDNSTSEGRRMNRRVEFKVVDND